MTKAIIFDLNGVFIRSPKLSERFSEKFGVPEADFLSALKEILAKVRLPNAGDAFSHWQPYLQEWGVSISREEFFDFWFSAEREVSEMIAFARELKKKGLKIFILSNNFTERADFYYVRFPFLREIPDKVYYSWQTGFVKPSEKAYKLVLKENNLRPDECIYFDDSSENIKVASDIGIKSFLFTDIGSVRKLVNL